MKTMKLKDGAPVRVKESDVNRQLKQGYTFCPKADWKKLVRDFSKKSTETVVEATAEITESPKAVKKQKIKK